ncbi:hypothetical protein KOW79_017783 [Hemibagrus wyckioides]|uniref:Uncharacterized protein n=1 Tax=Hemibagrus wyckioides TaxID=337641 RepID=A0A9D3SHK0_9TELE|nr:hypothetical protein KOW79_017783 [Hemibagrus wyckioides]
MSELSIDRAITVTLRHKQMCQPLKFALVNVSPGSLDLQPANRRFAICCDQCCMLLPLESRSSFKGEMLNDM